ncbi:MAG: TIR domain-containing protein [Calditrichae bacterium]|nr:TIR domain-containing protein [Calditrichia bacterium]
MKIQPARVFISYARKDLGKVKELYQQLQEAGFSPWQDIHEILPGEVWHDALMRAIREAPFFLACLSTNSVNKRGVIQEELKEALQIWRGKLDDDIYFIPVRLEDCPVPEALAKFQWVDLHTDGGFAKLHRALRAGMEKIGIIAPLPLRSQLAEDLSEDDVTAMLERYDFYDFNRYWMGKGIHHLYEAKDVNGHPVVIDHTTGLMWQQGGSPEEMTYERAQAYIAELNNDTFANFADWRLPTLEEAMSLMEAKQTENKLYISTLFDEQQKYIWTADTQTAKNRASAAWGVSFFYGRCVSRDFGFSYYVRAVRVGPSS